jgi:hypothetical protein
MKRRSLLQTIEKIKYSEKGREVKIYAPVRKLIVVVPEKTDRKSITDILRKYVGVVLAAVFASSLIEFLLFKAGAPPWMVEKASYSYDIKDAADSLNIVAAPETVNASAKGGINGFAEMNQTQTVGVQSVAAATSTPVPTPLMHEGDTVKGGGVPDMLANIAETFTSHPGLLFLL